jgi:DNA-binding NarL/FixJ family response regulator
MSTTVKNVVTPAEKRVLDLVGQGYTNKMIAYLLGVSEHTVKIHLAHLYKKTNTHNRIQLYIATRHLY